MSLPLVQFLLVCGLSAVNAGVTSGVAASDASASVSPSVTSSDKKFFGKGGEYPGDKRPKVDVLHFKHPYPVVQDSDDFDRDFVKDENSDNGSWKAQMEYDRLRHKLLKEKGDVAKALAAKDKAEHELEEAIKKEKDVEDKHKQKEAQKKEEKKEEEEKSEKKKGTVSGSKGESDDKEKQKVSTRVVVPGKKTPGGVTSDGEVKVAAGETQKAMDALDECKEELKIARKKLKDLMDELEAAKKKQEETEKLLAAAMERIRTLEAGREAVQKIADKEKQEYLDAKAAYEKQKALVEKYEAQIKVSAAKVKAMRDAEDKDGGVYNTGKNGASQHSVAPLLALMLVVSNVM